MEVKNINSQPRKFHQGHWIWLGVLIGTGLGVIVGVAVNNVAIGTAIGACIGITIGTILERLHKNEVIPFTLEEKKERRLIINIAIVLTILGVLTVLGFLFFSIYLS